MIAETLHVAPAASTAVSLMMLSFVGAAGLALGSIKVRGIGLGSAGVLFAGLIVGSFGFRLDHAVLEFLREFGLMLFVFMMGLQLGPGFFASLRRAGIKLNLFAVAIVILGFLSTWLCGALFDIRPGARLGLFSGATTNTPSLGARPAGDGCGECNRRGDGAPRACILRELSRGHCWHHPHSAAFAENLSY